MPKAAKTYEEEFRCVFDKQCGYYGYKTRVKQSEILGIPQSTLNRLLRCPDFFTRRQLMRIYTVLHFNEKERDLLNHTGRMKS